MNGVVNWQAVSMQEEHDREAPAKLNAQGDFSSHRAGAGEDWMEMNAILRKATLNKDASAAVRASLPKTQQPLRIAVHQLLQHLVLEIQLLDRA